MKKVGAMLMRAMLFGLASLGMRQLVKAYQGDEETDAKSNAAPTIVFFMVISLILILAFSVQIRDFLAQLF
ncbi:hypothetical protein JNUCC1_00743 [Lentibacillus sp. JNUCC-1]|uniref:hypothetical protein n=1 Tax=Lentibacillus sp. JNUCC-1 TaxID=2654513 RepID=UPI0012E7E3D7|nr:hypothetical protein [Lentibacillus sp. JNUCC-1]MUV36939.1 hypothetical protein [Lentibacillus sp. JNUCC-1]